MYSYDFKAVITPLMNELNKTIKEEGRKNRVLRLMISGMSLAEATTVINALEAEA